MRNATETSPAHMVFIEPGTPPSKREILQAALRLFAERGVNGVSIRDIAEAAGYSNPALFKFFDSKESMALFLFERCYCDLYDRIDRYIAQFPVFDDRLQCLVIAVLEQLDREPSMVLFVQDHLRVLWPLVSKKTRSRSFAKMIQRVLQDGYEQGAVQSNANLRLLDTAIIGTLAQFARLAYFGEFKKPFTQYAPELTRMFRNIARY